MKMKVNLQDIKSEVDKLKIKHEELENGVRNMVKKVEENRFNVEEIDKHKSDENKVFDELVSGYKEAIEEIEEKLLKLEANNTMLNVKKCKYQNKGFCTNLKCKFYYPEEVCQTYIKDGICVAQNCHERHPKTCRYWKKGCCRQGQSCAFGHYDYGKFERNQIVENPNQSNK